MGSRLLLAVLTLTVPVSAARAAQDGIAREVAVAFRKAVKQHAAMDAQPRQQIRHMFPGARVPRDAFAACTLIATFGGFESAVLNASPAMEALVRKVDALAGDGTGEAAREYCERAVPYLSHEQPAYRAVACEFLAHFPVAAIELGLVPVIAGLLSDPAPAFPAVTASLRPSGRNEVAGTVQLSVADVARFALTDITNFAFADREVFSTWWRQNRNLHERVWYWAVRWRKRETQKDLDRLAALEPRTALKILLLVGNSTARQTEAALPWIVAGDQREPSDMLPMAGMMAWAPTAETITAFVRNIGLRDFVLGLLSGDEIWPETAHGTYRYGFRALVKTLIPVCEQVLERTDAQILEAALNDGKGLSASSAAIQTDLALLAATLAPDRAEDIMVSQLRRNPTQRLLAAALVERTGTHHWDLVRASYFCDGPYYPSSSLRPQIVRALGGAGAGARARLLELFRAEHLSAALTEHHSPASDWHYRDELFRAFAAAAQSVNGGTAVVDDELLEEACFQLGMVSGERQREEKRHNAGVPAARERALAKLRAFLEQ